MAVYSISQAMVGIHVLRPVDFLSSFIVKEGPGWLNELGRWI